MVRYTHPVFRNGHRVLYHGAWRTEGHSASARKSTSASDDGDDDATPATDDKAADGKPIEAKPATYGSAHEFIVLVDTDDATSLRMATELVNAAKSVGLKARAWAGRTSPSAVASFTERDGGDFAVMPIDVLAVDPKAADLRAKAPLVARLANEPIVVIAAAGVDNVKKLDGRPVSFGEAGGVVDTSGQALLALLGVAPKVVHGGVVASLSALSAGKIDALVMLGADESRPVNEAAKGGKLHALNLPWSGGLAARYAPARMTSQDLPGLTPAGVTVDTISVPIGLVALDAAEGSARASGDSPFVAALFERYKLLTGASADPKWREVNLTAETDWPRLAPAQGWIEKHRAAADPVLDTFRDTAKTASTDASATKPAIADKLYESLLRSGAAQP